MTAELIQKLADAGIAHPGDEMRVILTRLGLRTDEVWSKPDEDRLNAIVERRAAREPLAYILQEQGFWSLDLAVSPFVLTPRPDTECLVETVLKAVPDKSVPLRLLDLGTGSGAIMLALLSELPHATGLGTDQSPEALSVAEINAHQAGLSGRARFGVADWTKGVQGMFDLIVSNPPYIKTDVIGTLAPEVRDHEPHIALDGGADGLEAYRSILSGLEALSHDATLLGFEIGFDQAGAVTSLMIDAGWPNPVLTKDYGGNPRVLASRRAG